jgi:transposase
MWFAMVLCCSQHLFFRPVTVMDQRAWMECHVAAFAFFAAVPARLDNLKTGVDKPGPCDPRINRSYAELVAHYGSLPAPAGPASLATRPRPGGRWRYIRDSFWRGREFTSVEQMQAQEERRPWR